MVCDTGTDDAVSAAVRASAAAGAARVSWLAAPMQTSHCLPKPLQAAWVHRFSEHSTFGTGHAYDLGCLQLRLVMLSPLAMSAPVMPEMHGGSGCRQQPMQPSRPQIPL